MSLRTPLSRVLGLGTARDGTGHFMAQRISAIALALLGSWFVMALAGMPGYAYLEVIRFVGQPTNAVLLTLTVLTLCYHSWLGVQVVIEDYLHGPGSRMFALIAARFAHALLAVAGLYAILKMGINA